ncbi:hypothetical protein [Actinotalea sp. Marseille-Q4924]|uniref:hypothetical protein n=1 Tax=Actinotalea sp. Marseille-Q4924 TaxID=2866571 RepID=UPI001CE3C2F1|nr:hypothetical protein [Actinotalea sp. Marseille-Q4924]
MRRTGSTALVGIALAAVLTACASGTGESPGGPDASPTPDPTEPTVILTPEPDSSSTKAPGGTPSPGGPPVGTTAADAVADLAERLGVEPASVTVVRDEAVTWRDGSLGCPAPGMAYTQALTPGRLVVLEAGGRTVEYHSGGRRGLFLCENPQPPAQTEPDR